MYSDDEQVGFGAGRGGRDVSPGFERHHDRGRRSRSRSRGRGGGGRGRSRSRSRGKGHGKGKDDKGKGKRPRTTGRDLPRLNSIHQATVVSIQSFGAFVRLGDGDTYKDGLLHISRISSSGRVEAVEDILAQDDKVWVKVCDVNEDAQKHSVDMRFVRQKDGEDLDPTHTQADSGRGAKGGGKGPEPIRIGAVLATTCSKCGAKGHLARECFGGSSFNLLDDVPDEDNRGPERSKEAVPGVDPKIVKAAMKAYMEREALGGKSKKDKKKEDKKEKKRLKKEKKKEKKEQKKQKKKEKKAQKKDAKKEKKEEKVEKRKEEKVEDKREDEVESKKEDKKTSDRKEKQEEKKEVKKEEKKEGKKDSKKEASKETQVCQPCQAPVPASSGKEIGLASIFDDVSSSSSSSSSS